MRGEGMIVSLNYEYGREQLQKERSEAKLPIRALQAKIYWINRELKLRYPPPKEEPNADAEKRALTPVSGSI